MKLLLGLGPVGDIADGGVLDGMVMLSGWVVKGFIVFVAKRGKCCFALGLFEDWGKI